MSTLKATKDKARFVSNPISQDALDTDWVDHEVVTKYKLPEITIEGTSTSTSLDTYDAIATGDSVKVYNATDGVVSQDVGTVTKDSDTAIAFNPALGNYTFSNANLTATKNVNGTTDSTIFTEICTSGVLTLELQTVVGGGIMHFGVSTSTTQTNLALGYSTEQWCYADNGRLIHDSTNISSWGETFSNKLVKLIYTHSSGKLEFFVEGVSQGVAYTLPAETDVYGAIYLANGGDSVNMTNSKLLGKYTTDISSFELSTPPTKAFFNKTIDTTLSAEATGKCKSSTITQIGVL